MRISEEMSVVAQSEYPWLVTTLPSREMEGFSYFTPFSSVAVYGGNDGDAWEVQKKGLLSGADVVIATPGRLLSHINLYNIDFSGVKYFILT